MFVDVWHVCDDEYEYGMCVYVCTHIHFTHRLNNMSYTCTRARGGFAHQGEPADDDVNMM